MPYNSPFAAPQVDFSMLAKLPELYQQGIQNAQERDKYQQQQDLLNARKAALAKFDGSNFGDLSKSLFAAGDLEGGLQAAKLLNNGGELTPEIKNFQFAQTHPEFASMLSEKMNKPKELSVSDVDKLGEQANTFETGRGLYTDFTPGYAGRSSDYNIKTAKEGIALPGGFHITNPMVSEDDKKAADWWDRYNLWMEAPRHGLIGSVMTPAELKDFNANRISPTTDPDLAKKNLRAQLEIMARVNQRRSAALKAGNYRPEAIDAAIGTDFSLPGESAAPQPTPVPTMNVAPDGTMTPTQADMLAPPVPGATQPIVPHQTPQATASLLKQTPEGKTLLLTLSNGQKVRGVKKGEHWYSADDGSLIQ